MQPLKNWIIRTVIITATSMAGMNSSINHCSTAYGQDFARRFAVAEGRVKDGKAIHESTAVRLASFQEWQAITGEQTGGGARAGGQAGIDQGMSNPTAMPNSDGIEQALGQNMGSAGGQSGGQSGDQDLATKLVDPTASVTTLNFQNRYVSSFHGIQDEQNTFVFQPVIPYRAFGTNHIFRATLPYRMDGPFRDGTDPVTLFDLFLIPASWGRWGVGPVVSFLPQDQSGRDTIQAGPAIGFVTQQGKWTLGAFNQNLISGDSNLSFLQPVIAYTINPKWTISAGDLQEGYDWKSDQWVTLPIGFQVGRLVQVGKTTLRLAYNPQYNFRDLNGVPEWTHLFGVSLIVK